MKNIRKKAEKDREELECELYRQIGQLKVELEWLKKNPIASVEQKRACIEPEHTEIQKRSIRNIPYLLKEVTIEH